MRKDYSTKDYNVSDLPKNRREQFFDTVKQEWKNILGIGLVLFVSFLPIFLTLFISDYVSYSIYSNTSYTKEQINSYLFTVQIIKHAVLIPAFMIFSLGLIGSFQIIKSLVWGEGIFFFSDFFKGIKQNLVYVLITSLIIGITNFLSMLVINAETPLPTFVSYLPLAIVALIILPIFYFSNSFIIIYDNKIGKTWKDVGYLYIRHFFPYFLFYLISMMPLSLLFIPNFMVRYFLILAMNLLYLPFALLMTFLFSLNIFDKHINEKNYPQIYRKGLYNNKEN